jgi:bla regulator protein blaR1
VETGAQKLLTHQLRYLRLVWVVGTIVFTLPLGVGLWSLRRLRRNGLPWPELRQDVKVLAAERGIRVPIEVLLHEDISAPLTCGLRRPAILLPGDAREWRQSDLRQALIHEMEHIRRGDWTVQFAARAICSGYWFHPLIWLAWRGLCLEAERASDDAVIQREERAGYAEQLVSLARRMSKARVKPALGMANRSDLSKRISAVLDSSQRRGRAGGIMAASALIVASLVVLVIAPVEGVAQAPAARQPGLSSNKVQPKASSPLNRALYEAAEDGDVLDMERLVNAGADVNSTLSGDGSPLIGAARKGNLAAVRWLLDRSADPNLPVRGDGNPLITAAREGHADVVNLLLDRGANINQAVPDDENALIQASGMGHLQVVKLLVGRGAEVNARVRVERVRDAGEEWRSPLSMARNNGHQAVVDYLLSVGARE